jgi:AAA ATPase domain
VGVSGPDALVGRQAEIAALDALTARTTAGTGGVVLLAGEPGMGKTRLAREAARRAEAAGVAPAWAACRESAHAPPLRPWLQVLRHVGADAPLPGGPSGPADGAAAYGLGHAGR